MATRRDSSIVRYIEMLRNGYARPSFAADSAAKIRRKLIGTCFVANLPPIYSVGSKR